MSCLETTSGNTGGGDVAAPVPNQLTYSSADVVSGVPLDIGDGALNHRVVVIGLFASFPGTVTATRDTISFIAQDGSPVTITSLVVAQSIVINLQNTQGIFRLNAGEQLRITNSNVSAWRIYVVWGYVDA